MSTIIVNWITINYTNTNTPEQKLEAPCIECSLHILISPGHGQNDSEQSPEQVM